MKYKWCRTGYDADATKVGKELESINNGELTNRILLNYAKENKDSELYKCFEWDDRIASERYRLSQATDILQSISIVVEEKQEVVKAYVNVQTKEENKVYKPLKVVLNNEDEYAQLVKKAEREFISYKEKYNKLIQLQDLKDIIFKNL